MTQFTFLGYAFRPRLAKSSRGVIFTSFSPGVSPQELKRMRDRVKAIGLLSVVHMSIEEIAGTLNQVLQSWMQYYGRFFKRELVRSYIAILIIRLQPGRDVSTSSCEAIVSAAGSFSNGSGRKDQLCLFTSKMPVLC